MQWLFVRLVKRLGKGCHETPARSAAAELGQINDADERFMGDDPPEGGAHVGGDRDVGVPTAEHDYRIAGCAAVGARAQSPPRGSAIATRALLSSSRSIKPLAAYVFPEPAVPTIAIRSSSASAARATGSESSRALATSPAPGLSDEVFAFFIDPPLPPPAGSWRRCQARASGRLSLGSRRKPRRPVLSSSRGPSASS